MKIKKMKSREEIESYCDHIIGDPQGTMIIALLLDIRDLLISLKPVDNKPFSPSLQKNEVKA